jgi:thymidylate synthase (FAD)
MKKEDARYILPQGCTTSIRMCLNYQAWEHFFKLRCDKHAQWEIRELAEEIRRVLNTISGGFFGGH